MIPENLVEFIQGNTFIYIGARNEKLQTTCNRFLGAKVNPDGDSFTCYIPKPVADKLLNYLDACNKTAVTMSTLPSHEAYQFKGTCTSIRDADNGELALAQAYLDKMVPFTSQFGMPEEAFSNFIVDPSIAVTIKVEEIYDQTPGPEAGKLIFPN